jgi:hypothetical protein
MSIDVERLVRGCAEHIDSLSIPVDIDTLLERDYASDVRRSGTPLSLGMGVGVGLVAFVVILVGVGLAGVFRTADRHSVATTPTTESVIVPTENSSLLTWFRVGDDDGVIGDGNAGVPASELHHERAMSDVTVGGPGLVAVGIWDRGAAIWTSVDGITWVRVAHDEAVFGARDSWCAPSTLP